MNDMLLHCSAKQKQKQLRELRKIKHLMRWNSYYEVLSYSFFVATLA